MNVAKAKSNKSHWKTGRNILPPCETTNFQQLKEILDLFSFLDAQRQWGKHNFLLGSQAFPVSYCQRQV
jgi:hypothetical protein